MVFPKFQIDEVRKQTGRDLTRFRSRLRPAGSSAARVPGADLPRDEAGPYLHDGRLLTLEDTMEFFSVILGVPLTGAEKRDLVAFLRAL